jgi:hypothetical protein
MDVVPVNAPFLVNVQASLEAWRAYQQLCQTVLDENDYATIKGRKARKRSGWAKLRRFMNVSAPIQAERFIEIDGDWGFEFVVRAIGPDGRYEDGDGSCFHSELAEGGGIAPTRHNVRAKALTRAKNRATADLIGGGEVSAEELEGPEEPPRPVKKAKANGVPARPASPDVVKGWLRTKAAKKSGPPNEKQIVLLASKIGEALQDRDDKTRHLVYGWLWGAEHSAELPDGAIQAMLDWLVLPKDEATGDYPLHPDAVQELIAIHKQAQLEAGQQEMGV